MKALFWLGFLASGTALVIGVAQTGSHDHVYSGGPPAWIFIPIGVGFAGVMLFAGRAISRQKRIRNSPWSNGLQ